MDWMELTSAIGLLLRVLACLNKSVADLPPRARATLRK